MHMDVSSLLKSENRCLKRFLELSERFLASDAADGAAGIGGALEGLNRLQEEREKLLRAMAFYDRKITEAVTALPTEARTRALAESVQAALNEKEAVIRSIFVADQQIIRRIEERQAALTHELAASKKTQETVNKFKSRWVTEGGEELDTTL